MALSQEIQDCSVVGADQEEGGTSRCCRGEGRMFGLLPPRFPEQMGFDHHCGSSCSSCQEGRVPGWLRSLLLPLLRQEARSSVRGGKG